MNVRTDKIRTGTRLSIAGPVQTGSNLAVCRHKTKFCKPLVKQAAITRHQVLTL